MQPKYGGEKRAKERARQEKQRQKMAARLERKKQQPNAETSTTEGSEAVEADSSGEGTQG